jgi:hypothetical protein
MMHCILTLRSILISTCGSTQRLFDRFATHDLSVRRGSSSNSRYVRSSKHIIHVLDQKIVTASLIITHVLWLGSTLILKSICDQKIFMVAAHEDFHASCTHRREQFSHGCCIPTQIGSGALLLITFLPAQHMLLC